LPTLHLIYSERDKTEDSKPIQLGPPSDILYRLKLTLPTKYQARAPLPLKVTRDYAEYSSSYTLTGIRWSLKEDFSCAGTSCRRRVHRTTRPLSRRSRRRSANTLLETDLAGTPAIPTSVKVEELIQAAEAAEKNENYPLAEELLKRVLERNQNIKAVRRNLGLALFSQRKYDEAAAVLKDQTRINPFDDYCYDLLGRTLWRQQKYDEAVAAFRKQIEVTPLHREAHGNLGQMLVEWRKYKEALPELEQGIALNPEGESLYVISVARISKLARRKSN